MTRQDFHAIKSRLADITPGPWLEDPDTRSVFHAASGGTICEVNFDNQTGDHQPGADQTFIAHAPTDIAMLIAEVERLSYV